MYVGSKEEELWDAYHMGASKLQAHGYFYAASPEVAQQHLDVDQTPCVFVYKEGLQYYFDGKAFYLYRYKFVYVKFILQLIHHHQASSQMLNKH